MQKYDPHMIQQSTRAQLESNVAIDTKNKKYILAMFPYPSGQFHMGHARCYTIADVLTKYYRANGHHVFSPMGWDAFGLPAENAAIKHNKHPKEWTDNNIVQMRQQFDMMGLHFNWDHELKTCQPEYYRWQQWLFIQMYRSGIAYRKKATVNWDPVDQTVLANEQVIDGRGWRSGELVERKEINQWFLKITEYADQLLEDCSQLSDWPEQVVTMQENWIGRSNGVEMTFKVKGLNHNIEVYTTRADTLMGTQALVLAPTHPLCIKASKDNAELAKQLNDLSTSGVSEAEIEAGDKKGCPIGYVAICPISGREIPIWAGNYVLMDYGHGAVIMVPAHCDRDYAFAKQYKLPIKAVIETEIEHDYTQSAMVDKGRLVHSLQFNGLSSEEAIHAIAKTLQDKKMGKAVKQYRLRDWGISRQRYWGCPIPMIHCPHCGIVAEKEENLPVILPTDIEFKANHQILAEHHDFINTTCPECGSPAKRETDTFDTFFDSSWYFSRFVSPSNDDEIFDSKLKAMLPVDIYVGGIEHAILHLLYARFIFKFMKEINLTDQNEPFKELLTQGMVLKDGTKMSKSKGNLVTPSELYEQYGADALRLFVIFAAPPSQNLEWSDAGLEGMHRFLKKVVTYFTNIPTLTDKQDPSIWTESQQILSKIEHDYEKRQLNTTVAGCMKLFNLIQQSPERNQTIQKIEQLFLMTLYPLAPHTSCHLWQGSTPIIDSPWPQVDQSALSLDEQTIVVQFNGKKRGQIMASKSDTEASLVAKIRDDSTLSQYLPNTVNRVIYVKNRLINIVG